MQDLITLKSSAVPESVAVMSFRGVEAISRPYEFEIFFSVNEAVEIDMADSISAKATLTIDRDDGRPPFVFHGTFASLQLVHAGQGTAIYRALLVPQLWQLTLTRYSRVFTKKSIPKIIEAILEDGGLSSSDYRLQLNGDYPTEEHVCQYQESNLDFIHRWMEREGIYYYFEQGDTSEVLVITDYKAAHGELVDKPIRYHPTFGMTDYSAGECFDGFTCQHTSVPANIRFADYDYANPSLEVAGRATASRTGLGELSFHGARFFTPEEGNRLAKLRAEELLARQVVIFATGTALYLRSGYIFELEDHPREALNKRYLATEVRHFSNQAATTPEMRRLVKAESDDIYRVEVAGILADTQFRSPQRTPWPRIYGLENGVVDGPSTSEYAQIDDQGRYLVRFNYDENDLPEGSASTYMRMMQPHGGSLEGFHFPLRKGTEVVLAFLGGDPDRPVIAGVVPNAHRPSPVTSRNHTQNVIRTGGNNHMVLEDIEGKQHIDLYTPICNTNAHLGGPINAPFLAPPTTQAGAPALTNVDCAFYLFTEGAAGFDVYGDWWQNVGSDYRVDVLGSATIRYVGIHTLNINADSNEFYNAHRNTTIHAGRTDKVEAGGMTQDIHGGLTQTIEPGGKQEVTGGWTHKVTATNHDHYGTWQTDVGQTWTATIGGAVKIESTGSTVTVKGSTQIMLDAPSVTINGAQVSTKSTAFWKGWAASSLEGYNSKNSVGIHKSDSVAISNAINGVKTELTGMAMARTGIKLDFVNVKADNASMKLKAGAISVDTKTSKITQAALKIFSCGLTKL